MKQRRYSSLFAETRESPSRSRRSRTVQRSHLGLKSWHWGLIITGQTCSDLAVGPIDVQTKRTSVTASTHLETLPSANPASPKALTETVHTVVHGDSKEYEETICPKTVNIREHFTKRSISDNTANVYHTTLACC